jgi:hypothetical protein
LTEPDRYKIPVRATRAYVAGFGTSGSLLAGAAALFLLGSAIVAFRGWPQIATGPATSNVAPVRLAVPSRASTRLSHALVTTRLRIVRRGAVTRLASAGPGRRRVAGTSVTTGAGGGPGIGSTGQTRASSGSNATGACGGCNTPTSLIGNLITTVAQKVSTVGTDVGKQITGESGNLGRQVGSVNPQAGAAIGAVGSTAGNAVTGVTTTAVGALSGGH